MGRTDPLFGFCVYPAAKNASAGKNESVRAVIAENRKFKVTIERCRGNRLPLNPTSEKELLDPFRMLVALGQAPPAFLQIEEVLKIERGETSLSDSRGEAGADQPSTGAGAAVSISARHAPLVS